MHKLRTLIFIPLLLIAESCDKNPTIPGTQVETSYHNLKIVWETPLSDKTIGNYRSMEPFIYDGKIISSVIFHEFDDYLYGRDLQTGETIWEWQEPGSGSFTITQSAHVHDGYLAIISEPTMFVADLNSGTTIWKKTFSNLGLRPNGHGSTVYLKRIVPSVDPDASHVLETSIYSNTIKGVVSITKGLDGYAPYAESINEWVNPSNGDTIVVFQVRKYHFDKGDNNLDLYGYNKTADSMNFHLEDVSPSGASTVHQSLVWDNKAYFKAARSQICVDLQTGTVKWLTHLPETSLTQCDHLLHNGVLYTNGDNKHLYALDAHSGEILWHNSDALSSSVNMRVYQDRLYIAGGASDGYTKLHCFNTMDGSLVWAHKTPRHNNHTFSGAGFQGGLAIDEETGYLYTHDNYYLMCIDLKE